MRITKKCFAFIFCLELGLTFNMRVLNVENRFVLYNPYLNLYTGLNLHKNTQKE